MTGYMTPRTMFSWSLPLLLSLGGLQACSAEVETASQNWPTECVGHMQFQLPGPADVAAFSLKRMQEYIKKGGYPNSFTFADGVPAPFARSIAVSHPLTEANKVQLKSLVAAEKAEMTKLNAIRKKKEGSTAPYFGDLPSPPFDRLTMMGWQFKERLAVRRFVGDSMVVWSLDLSNANSIVHARPRPIFEVPKEPGLCLPYVFAPDDGRLERGLSMSFRLKDHPDIQITLTDASAFKPERLNASGEMPEAEVKLRNKHAEPEQEIGYFWLERLNAARKYESQWLVPDTTRPVTLAGYKGLQSFVRLTMDDGTLNYGYYAVVRGNPDAAEDTPDLRLYVRQDVRQAEGKTPLTKEQFIEMAQAIASSVQRRPVAPN